MKFNYIQHYNSTEFNYPFEELRHELGIFQAKCVTSTTFNWLKNTIDSFKYKLCYNFNLSESEIGEFEIIYSLNEVATVRCRNIFTACILYDHYIPNFLLKCADVINEVIFTNGDRIYYDNNINEFMMELGNDIDNIDLSNNFIIKPEVELPPINWNDFDPKLKRGRMIIKENYEYEEAVSNDGKKIPGYNRTKWISIAPPVFTQDRSFLDKLIPKND